MILETKVLRPDDMDLILAFERKRLIERFPDETERELESWNANWRQEALEHYLPLGWSFGVWSGETLNGYFLAQPFLFFRGMTQTLWVEHLSFENQEICRQLLDLVYRCAREKHLQKVLIHQPDAKTAEVLKGLGAEFITDAISEMKTTKIL